MPYDTPRAPAPGSQTRAGSAPEPTPTGVARRQHGWQVGVGPGALVVNTVEPVPESALRLALGLAAPRVDHSRPRCRVEGQGSLALRLRAALGDVGHGDGDDTSVVVLVHHHVVPPEVALARARRPGVTVPVVVQARRVVLGPVSGLGGPCLHCLDLARRDRDPEWAAVAAAWGHPTAQVEPVAVPAAVEDAAIGLTQMVVSSVLAGRPPAPGTALEVGADPPHVVTRQWRRHPACPAHRDP